jgi:hypothetical protein
VNKNWQENPPEDPDPFATSVEILVSAEQYAWLAKQCEFLCISKENLIRDAIEEWFRRYQLQALPRDASAAVRCALDEFIRRHGAEFL